MDDSYFNSEREKFYEQIKAKEIHAERVDQTLVYVIGHCHNLLSQETSKLNQIFAQLNFQFSPPNDVRDHDGHFGETKVLCHGGIHSGVKYAEFVIRSIRDQPVIQAMSGTRQVGVFKLNEVDEDALSRLLIDHAFRCLRKTFKLSTDVSNE